MSCTYGTSVEIGRPALSPGDVLPFEVVNPGGQSLFLLVCEHAGTAVPASLDRLGLPSEAFGLHIASDVGAAAVARLLAASLDAPLILQPYSRLIVDCNRPFEAPDCFPEISDTVPIPGNASLSMEDRRERFSAIHAPFHREVAEILDRGGPASSSILVSIHSFTPSLMSTGVPRPWEIGLLFNRDDRFARQLMPVLKRLRPRVVAAFNEPYVASDATDYTIPVHGEGRGAEHVLIEIRNDLVGEPEGQADWAALLAEALKQTLSTTAPNT
jgi:predicted N-formylglutamate amidohydrolase